MTDVPPYSRDDDLLAATRADGRTRLRIYCPERVEVVLGRGSRAEVELDRAACAADDIPVLRRPGGGCAVVLDPGNVVVSLAAAVPGLGDNPAHFRRISEWLCAGLAEVGVPGVHQDGVSDLVLDDRKLGGSCLYRAKGLLLYSTTLLAAPDLARMERYLRHPPREPAYRRGRPHREFVTALAPAEGPVGAERLAAALRAALAIAAVGLPG